MKLPERFTKKEGGKTVADKSFLLPAASVITSVAAVMFIVFSLVGKDDSRMDKGKMPLEPPADEKWGRTKEAVHAVPLGVSKAGPQVRTGGGRKRRTAPTTTAVASAQVILRDGQDAPPPTAPLPSGTSAVGVTLQGVDTRDGEGTVRVLLPYGMAHKSRRTIPKETVLLGRISSAKGEKVFVSFHKAVYPDGKEYGISAHAVDPHDFTAGIEGTIHGNIDLKMAAAMGLSMVGAMGGVLAEKESLGGEYGRITVKSTLKDAALSGLSEVAERESRRRLEAVGREAHGGYATVQKGEALIVTLTEAFGLKKR